MRTLACALCALVTGAALNTAWGQPFYETLAPAEWTRAQAKQLTIDSPWARPATSSAKRESAAVPVLLVSAVPVQQALERIEQTAPQQGLGSDLEPEYRVMLKEKPGEYIMLGVSLPNPDALLEAHEAEDVEKNAVLRAGKRKYRVEAVLPPTPRMPYLILVFPRKVESGDKSLRFEIYVPIKPDPYRNVEFNLSELNYRGKAEY
jgi:hypothetical protein